MLSVKCTNDHGGTYRQKWNPKLLDEITGRRQGGTFPTHWPILLAEHGYDVVQQTLFDDQAFADYGLAYLASIDPKLAKYNKTSDIGMNENLFLRFLKRCLLSEQDRQ